MEWPRRKKNKFHLYNGWNLNWKIEENFSNFIFFKLFFFSINLTIYIGRIVIPSTCVCTFFLSCINLRKKNFCKSIKIPCTEQQQITRIYWVLIWLTTTNWEREKEKTINFLILVKYNHHHHFFRLSRWWINLIRIKTTTTTTKSFFLLWPIMKKEKNLWYHIDIDICCFR